jgi:hypothetical protein
MFEDKDYKRMLSKLENDLRQDIFRHKSLKADSDQKREELHHFLRKKAEEVKQYQMQQQEIQNALLLENENLKAKLSDFKAQVTRHATELSLCEKAGEKKLQ